MRFLLRCGDRIVIRRVAPDELRWGDIVVYFKETGFVAHRIYWKGARFWTKGDGQFGWDAPVPASGIIGRVEAFQRGDGPWVSLADRRLWHCSLGLASALFFCYPGADCVADRLFDAFVIVRDFSRRQYARLRDAFFRACAWSRDRIVDAASWLKRSSIEAWRWSRDRFLQTCAWSRDRLHDAWLWARDRALQACAWSRDRLLDLWRPLAAVLVRQGRRALAAVWMACGRLAPRRGRIARAGLLRLWLDIGGDPPAPQPGGELRWEGDVELAGPVVVPPGRALTVMPGTRVRVAAAGAWGVDRLAFGGRSAWPAGGGCAVVVQGELEIAGEEGREVDLCGGVLLVGRGRARIRHARFETGEGFSVTGIDLSSCDLAHCRFAGPGGGAAWGGRAAARLRACRFSGLGKAAVRAHDDARVRLSGCRFEDNAVAVLVEAAATVADRGSEHSRGRQAGVVALGHGAFRARGSRWAGHAGPSAVFASGQAHVRLRGCSFDDNPVALEALQGARVDLDGVRGERNGTGVWAQNASRVELRGGAWQGNREAVRVSQESRVILRGAAFRGQTKTAVLIEERARVTIEGGEFRDNENGVLALQEARLAAAGARFEACRDTAIWTDYRCRLGLGDNVFQANGKDFHREFHPRYDGGGEGS